MLNRFFDRRPSRATLLKLAALAALAATEGPSWAAIASANATGLWWRHSYFAFSVYVGVFALCVVSVVLAPFLRSTPLRLLLAATIAAAFAADRLAFAVFGQHLNDRILFTLLAERRAEMSLSIYLVETLANVALGALLAAVFALPPTPEARLSARWASAPALAFVAVFAVIAVTRGGSRDFPPPFVTLADLALVDRAPDAITDDAIEDAGAPAPRVRQIVYIVDESVRADVLGLNNPRADNTPTLSAHAARIINFGVAIAAANCSHAARYMLKTGLRPEVTLETRRARSLFQFAEKAGYRTIVVDSWRGAFEYLRDGGQSHVGSYIPVSETPPYRRDLHAAQIILDLLASDEKLFIYFAKYGAHYPYDLDYPPEGDAIRRNLSFLDYAGLTPPRNMQEPQARSEALRQYDKALRWSVDEFWRALLARRDYADALVLYTSDHGQSLWEEGARISHCSNRAPARGEILTPIFMTTDAPAIAAELRAAAARAPGAASAFDIYPTLLWAMGYDREWTRKNFGVSLVDLPVVRQRRYAIGGAIGSYDWADGSTWLAADPAPAQ